MKNNEHSKGTNHSNINADNIRAALDDSGDNIKQFSSVLVEELDRYFEGKKATLLE